MNSSREFYVNVFKTPLTLNFLALKTPCALRLVEAFWLVETFVSECLNFN